MSRATYPIDTFVELGIPPAKWDRWRECNQESYEECKKLILATLYKKATIEFLANRIHHTPQAPSKRKGTQFTINVEFIRYLLRHRLLFEV